MWELACVCLWWGKPNKSLQTMFNKCLIAIHLGEELEIRRSELKGTGQGWGPSLPSSNVPLNNKYNF